MMFVPTGTPSELSCVTTTWIMLTPSEAVFEPTCACCSFRITYPIPSRSILVFGSGVAPIGSPATTRLTNDEPVASVWKPEPSRDVSLTARTSSAVINPPSTVASCTSALAREATPSDSASDSAVVSIAPVARKPSTLTEAVLFDACSPVSLVQPIGLGADGPDLKLLPTLTSVPYAEAEKLKDVRGAASAARCGAAEVSAAPTPTAISKTSADRRRTRITNPPPVRAVVLPDSPSRRSRKKEPEPDVDTSEASTSTSSSLPPTTPSCPPPYAPIRGPSAALLPRRCDNRSRPPNSPETRLNATPLTEERPAADPVGAAAASRRRARDRLGKLGRNVVTRGTPSGVAST